MSSNLDANVPTELYSLIFQFLKDTGLSQTAKIFKKEINKSIKDINQKHGLVEIFKSYNSLIGNIEDKAESDDSTSSSSSESSSNDEENESSNESSLISSDNLDESSDEEVKNDDKVEDSSSSEDDDDTSSIGGENTSNPVKESNSSDSSSEESESEQNAKVQNINEGSHSSNEPSDESSSSNNSSSDEENNNMEIRPGEDKEHTQDSKETSSNSSSSDNESEEGDSESENESETENTQINIIISSSENHLSDEENRDKLSHSKSKVTNFEIYKSETSDQNISSYKINEQNGISLTNGDRFKHKLDSNNDTYDTRPSKKVNSNLSSTYVTTSVHFKPRSVIKSQRKNNKSNKTENKSNGNGNTYNRRINPEKVEFLDERLKDNSFLAKDGAIDSYGYRAHNDLFAIRGKDFRAQKTKKKRGSYRGGKIDFESHSIKFAVDD
ncbi:SRP40, C-terminal domain-containing protein [Glomus cerebriforme]|uniref:SRP40, C-terminal domain-containing protein n=1 Tax=Glomus cerebriforme TaxID=658196 RepID=A0A397TEA8_9GLOM|nr:SRP40, C-terminal domain-containing protein [Glomus cerebriforme]